MTIAKTGTLNYVSPESETIVIHNEGTVLSGSHDNEFEFIYEDDEMLDGGDIIID